LLHRIVPLRLTNLSLEFLSVSYSSANNTAFTLT
jgi:hypothetical protein